jgi:hypothetical protein
MTWNYGDTTAFGTGVLVGRQIKAEYHDPLEPMYQGNPFIAALPEPLEPEEVARNIKQEYAIPYDPREREWPVIRRLEAVPRLESWVAPTDQHIDLHQRIGWMQRLGYKSRRPIATSILKEKGVVGDDFTDYLALYRHVSPSTAIIGASGVGKTTTIDTSLLLSPQVVEHSVYHGIPFERRQLVWLKVETPQDGSLKALSLNLLHSADIVLGTSYYQRCRGLPDAQLSNAIYDFARQYALGLVVYDETQRLRDARAELSKHAMNYFVRVSNQIPSIWIGTYKALALFNSLALMRRGSGFGSMIWHPMAFDASWDYLASKLWAFQWTRQETPLTKKLSKALYDESAGIVALACKLYMLVQLETIGQGEEKITPGVIRNVAAERLKLIKPALEALKRGDEEQLKRIDDIAPVLTDLEPFLQAAKERARVEGALTIWRTGLQRARDDGTGGKDPREAEIRKRLELAGFSSEIARESAVKALELCGTEQDVGKVIAEASSLAEDQKQTLAEKRGKKTTPVTLKGSFPGSLRKIAETQGEKDPHEALMGEGVIASPEAILGEEGR